MNEETMRCIRFANIPGIGPLTQTRLLNLCGSISNCFSIGEEELLALDAALPSTGRIGSARIRRFIATRNDPAIADAADRISELCEKKQIRPVTLTDTAYPDRFRGLSRMPVVCYVRGNLDINAYPAAIGVIGARRCSPEGKQRAIQEAEKEIRKGVAIISGMAKGIDSYAHTAAIKNGGYTIAVLGNGPDICYPKEHKRLYETIIEHGCVLSEYPPGTTPRRYMFPQRNRLIAALSDTLYVVDAGRHSGTETTVEACRESGKEVVFFDVSEAF